MESPVSGLHHSRQLREAEEDVGDYEGGAAHIQSGHTEVNIPIFAEANKK